MVADEGSGVELEAGTGGPATAAHIARVASRLFAARGYDAASVREIAEAAEVTKPTLYYHFGSKEGLAHALLSRPLDRFVEEMAAIGAAAGSDPIEVIVGMFARSVAFFREDPDRARFIFALFFGPRGELASSLAGELCRFGERIDGVWGAAVRRLAEAGVVADEPAVRADLTAALRGLVIVTTIDFLYQGQEPTGDLPGRLVRNLLDGYARAGRDADRGATGGTHGQG